jgi:hypothetical protein
VIILSSLFTRGLTSFATAALLVAASVPALSHSTAAVPDGAARAARMQERLQARLERMAQRLEINVSQQGAWAEYTRTVQSQIGSRPSRPPADADAAALLRFRADVAARHAQKLVEVADATAKLSAALSPEQRKTLDTMVRHQGGFLHKHRRGHI